MDTLDIKKERARLRISQSRLSARSGVSRFKMCLHERGDLTLNDQELARIRAALSREAERLTEELVEFKAVVG